MPCFRWIAGSSPAMTEQPNGPRMRRYFALLLITPLLAGCLERGQPTMVDTSGDDDAFCRANNVAVGSNEYVNCRKNRDVQRGNANARTDRAQRNLAEQMLNNPTRH